MTAKRPRKKPDNVVVSKPNDGENGDGGSYSLNGGAGSTSVIAEYTVDAPGYQAIVDELSTGRLSLEGETACSPEVVLLTFWVSGVENDSFKTALRQSEMTTDVQVVSEQAGGQTLYQVCLPASQTTYWEWINRGGVLLSGKAKSGEWIVRMRFPDREALVDFRQGCKKREIGFSLNRLSQDGDLSEQHASRLTEAQQSLLTTALENGYFEVPRGITLTEIASRFDISDQAASERLRRGLANKLEGSI